MKTILLGHKLYKVNNKTFNELEKLIEKTDYCGLSSQEHSNRLTEVFEYIEQNEPKFKLVDVVDLSYNY
jgi:hypothetical protein